MSEILLRWCVVAIAALGIALDAIVLGGVVPLGAASPLRPSQVLLLVEGVCFSLLSLLLAVRGWHSRQARLLSLMLLYEALVFLPELTGPGGAVLDVLSPILTGVGLFATVAFACSWQATPPALRRGLLPLGALAGGVAGVGYLVENEAVTLARGPAWLVHLSNALGNAGWTFGAALFVVGLAITAWHARGVERRRIGWVCLTAAITFGAWIVYILSGILTGKIPDPPLWVVLATVIFPLGLTYSIVRRDIVDVGFVLNRAAVFAATTAVVAVLFVVLQWGAEQVLVRLSGRNDFAVQIAVALIVLYLTRGLRVQTDTLVSRVFFARRQRRIAALRELARDVDALGSADAIGPFVVERLRTLAGIDAAVYVEDEGGFVRAAGTVGAERLDANAPPVVRLRASSAPAAFEDAGELGGAMLFPMTVRGRLRGGIACAYPAGDDEFAPDEAAALAALAAQVAVARDDVLAQTLRASQRELAERVLALERENVLLQRASGLSLPPIATAPGGAE